MGLLQELEKERDTLEAELASFEEKRRRLSWITALIKSYGTNTSQAEMPPIVEPVNAGRFKSMGVTDAIMAVLKEAGMTALTPLEIYHILIAGGMATGTQNFLTTIHTTCKRKSELGGPLVASIKEGKRAYQIKPLFA